MFTLQVATGCRRTVLGRPVLESRLTVAAAGSWRLAKAVQLIRQDARPHRLVALQLDRRAWGCSGPEVVCSTVANFWLWGGLICVGVARALVVQHHQAPRLQPSLG